MAKRYVFLFSILLILSTAGMQTQAQSTSFGDTLGAFNAGILTPTPDRGLIGVEYIDGYYWMTGFDPDDNWQHKLYKLDAATMTMDTIFSYGNVVAGWKDLAFDGSHLYVADMAVIRQIDTATGQPTNMSIPSPIYYNSGLAYDPSTDHFWVSGDGSLIYELDKSGNIINSISLPQQYPAAGLAWDTVSPGGPYLWVWSVKYTPSDVRPKALQLNPANGSLTSLEFEGVIMHPSGQGYAEQPLGACISQDIIQGKTVFVGMQQSSYQQINDQLDWVVLYDLAPDSVGVPGPEIITAPGALQNNLLPGDSLDVPVFINNLSPGFSLNWTASVQYPGVIDTNAILGDTLRKFDFTSITPDGNTRLKGIAYIDSSVWVSSQRSFDDKVFLYEYDLASDSLLGVDTLFSFVPGWNSITSDGQYIYVTSQYSIMQYDPVTKSVVANYPKIGFSPNGMAYDPQKEWFYLGGSTGALKIIDKQGIEQNFFVTPYNIQGLTWDNWSQGGPYLWAFHFRDTDSSMRITRLNPQTGGPTGIEFLAPNLSGDPTEKDFPVDIVVANNWLEGKLVMLALHESNTNPGDGNDKFVAYDLATAPSPGWISLLADSYGNIQAGGQDTLWVRLNAIMDDTLMMAEIIVKSNDVINPVVGIPVNFQMLPFAVVGVGEINDSQQGLIRSVYPNPATEKVIVDYDPNLSDARIALFNALGQQVFQSELETGKDTRQLDISDLVPGIYILRISGQIASTSQSVSKKLIIR